MSPSPSRFTVRTLTEADWDAFVAVDSHAFGMTAPPSLLEVEREILELDRTIGAYDGETLAGIASAYTFDLSISGGSVPAAGVTWVGVLPTYRRRGVLTALMTHQFDSIHDAGREPVAILWASEPQIYGRFGYGLSSRHLSMSVPRAAALHADTPSDAGLRLRLVPADDWKLTDEVYRDVFAARSGMVSRDERWWQRSVRDLPDMRHGKSELRCVVVEDDQRVRGYARYATKQSFDANFGSGQVDLREVLAVDGAALAALYRYLFDLDLMGTTELWNVPVDDPVLHWLQNPRRNKLSLGDSVYTRLVDVGAALEARTYAREVDLVLEVADDRCAWNAGRWRLRGGATGATCTRTDDAADLGLDVRELGAAYQGGTSLSELALAGRVREQTDGSLTAASAAFTTSPAPWCPIVF